MDITNSSNGDEQTNEPLQPFENDTVQTTAIEPSDAPAEQDVQQTTITNKPEQPPIAEMQQEQSVPPEPTAPAGGSNPQAFAPTPQLGKPTSITALPPQPMVTSQDVSGTIVPQQPASELNNSHSAGVFILQWVTYALWGWTLLVLSWVIFALVLSMLNESRIGEFILYPISALVILLPASVVADSFYSTKEPKTKKGGALAIMVIHVVIYVLFMIGFLIAAMLSIVNMAMSVSSGDSNDALGYLISSLLVSACYAMLIVRTLRPQTFRRMHEEN